VKKEKVLITVKTYPSLSVTYDETVCTAGMREDGSWIRIYPIPFRKLDDYEKYSKFDWIEVGVERNLKDHRPESHKKLSNIKILDSVGTESNWYARNEIVLNKGKVYTSFEEIIAKNKNNCELSLATFKPSRIIDVVVEEEEDRDWDVKKLREIEAKSKQGDFFQESAEPFKVVRKLPYKFRYVFEEENGKRRKIIITDWELGALYWKMVKAHDENEKIAVEKVRNKYLNELVNDRDIYFFVGTTLEWDRKNADNPFTIIGIYSPPLVLTGSLF